MVKGLLSNGKGEATTADFTRDYFIFQALYLFSSQLKPSFNPLALSPPLTIFTLE